MSEAPHQDNLSVLGPAGTAPEDIRVQKEACRYGTAVNSGLLAVGVVVEAGIIIPGLTEAIRDTDVVGLAAHAIPGTMLGGLSVLAVVNLRQYTRRWRQALINQKINQLTTFNEQNN